MVKVWMVFEALGTEKNAVIESLQEHVDTFKTENGVEILEMEKDEIEEMENPHEKLDKGFSQVLEMRVKFENFERAARAVTNYGPTYVQVEEPDFYDLSLKEGQQILQNIATTMHQYAQMGAGGVLISKSADEN